MKKIFLVFFLVFFIFSDTDAQQSWQPFGGGTNLEVFALTVYNGDLIVGGIFDTAGTVRARRIARWNGTNWSPLGNGTGGGLIGLGIVRCLTVYNGDLIAGGYFDSAGAVFARGIARWNGTAWSSIGNMGGVNPYVEALSVYNSELIAGGTFSTAGGVPATGIARWNGSVWQSLGSGIYPPDSSGVYSLAVYNSQLVAGGDFQQAGGVGTSFIGRWNGSVWFALGTGIQGVQVKTLAVQGSQLIAAGSFYQAGSVAANNIARWNGTTWATLTTGTNGDVYALQTIGTNLYVGGLFSFAGGISVNRISMWNGTAWSSLGVGSANGTNLGVAALANYPVSGTNLVCGGFFTTAGGNPAKHLAVWGDFTGLQNTNNQIPSSFSLSQNYPNPFNPSTKIRFSLPNASMVNLIIFDESGKKIDQVLDENLSAGNFEINWSPKDLSSGVYFCKITAGSYTKTIKMNLIK
jgi:hypothetical protein